jgi:hypothetical protein
MEWIVEGVALVSTGALVAAVAGVDAHGVSRVPGTPSPVVATAYGVAIASLLVLALVSVFTGFRVRFLPFRLCPAIFTISAVLIALGAWV